MARILCFFAAALLLFSGCKTDTPPDTEPGNQGLDYYPLATGNFWEYQVTEARQLGEGATPDTIRFQLRERVDSMFTDLAGEPWYRIFRSKRQTSSDTWADDSVIVVKKTYRRLERKENNVRLVKLVFPLGLQRTWDGNQMNDSDPETWRYTQIDVPYTLVRPTTDTTFQQTLQVVHADELNEVDTDTRWERYARQVGLIESYKFTSYSQSDPATGVFTVQQTFSRHFRLLRHGQE